MPFIEVTLVEGRTPQMKAKLIEKVTEATVEAIGAPIEAIRVCIREVPKENWGVAGQQKFISPD
ncbi:2-hydroxymuconate tautomerase [Celeribacter sp. PS-C1]|uniref:2-hydroxymuconate tautomerase n=1 Tax=Celeribacter sp. PS-C1 TaxID=2820813 RepID=UPI001C67FD2C|nr:2-hydroxymuconate tautomerase [Celeribacter sp. PS-C1]MBW6419094.1 4-oxalocrotonate tautomerase family protein [Celeribacter sp. PS-C1]